MFPKIITIAQALAANIDPVQYHIKTKWGWGEHTVGRIYQQDTHYYSEQHHSLYGWLKIDLDSEHPLTIYSRRKEPLEDYRACNPPNHKKPDRLPQRHTNLFSTSYFYNPEPSTRIDYSEAINNAHKRQYPLDNRFPLVVSISQATTGIVVWEHFMAHMLSNTDTRLSKLLDNYRDQAGIMALRDHALKLAGYVEDAYKIANDGDCYNLDSIAWDFDFIPTYLDIALDDNLNPKFNWKEIALALGNYYNIRSDQDLNSPQLLNSIRST